jgi:hypothetical protein
LATLAAPEAPPDLVCVPLRALASLFGATFSFFVAAGGWLGRAAAVAASALLAPSPVRPQAGGIGGGGRIVAGVAVRVEGLKVGGVQDRVDRGEQTGIGVVVAGAEVDQVGMAIGLAADEAARGRPRGGSAAGPTERVLPPPCDGVGVGLHRDQRVSCWSVISQFRPVAVVRTMMVLPPNR